LTAPHADLNFGRTSTNLREATMKWKTPVIIEIAVGLEINAYACAEVK
jgi:coenzyme PQQ precursor peptide PqqA